MLYLTMALRKVVLSSSTHTDNAVSFSNQTSRKLFVRKVVGRIIPSSSAGVLGESVNYSLDEIPVRQSAVNNSRLHIATMSATVAGGTGSIALIADQVNLTFQRDDLMIDKDESLFANAADLAGTLASACSWNIWYQD